MTNHWIDVKNADVVLIMGANPAENHPVSFRWILRAQDAGAKVIVVDPRFTHSAARADVYAPLRSGTDLAFLGGLLRHILENGLYFEEYVRCYTNGAFLVNADFRMPGELDGLFSGYDPKTRRYDSATWAFQHNADGAVRTDPTLRHPNCVLQLLKKHYSRYTPELVSAVTGTPREKLLEIYALYGATGRPDKAGTSLYAMGWTQHTVGTQNVRAMAMIQLLLGNVGIPGGGVNALRGESNVQGSTDHGLLFHLLPGYLPVPSAELPNLAAYRAQHTPKTVESRSANGWQRRDAFLVSYLKALYGAKATPENDFGYNWLPKLDPGMDGSWLTLFDIMHQGKLRGLFAWGQNPACSGANSSKVRTALAKLDWLVAVNLFDNETASFWKGPGVDPAGVKTEVFLLPAAASFEKEGSVTNSGRWVQWRRAAVTPLAQAKPDAEIIDALFRKLRQLYVEEGGALPEPLVNLTWNYGLREADGAVGTVDPHAVAREINGFSLDDVEAEPAAAGKKLGCKKGELLDSSARLRADGTTSCGCWLYCQSYTASGNAMARRGKHDPTGLGLFPEWSWAWPSNRRLLYNRASVDPAGKPFNPGKAALCWNPVAVGPDGTLGGWEGDVPDGPGPPLAVAGGVKPFLFRPHGVGALFGPGLKDGPFPEHYEPLESPVPANLLSAQRASPVGTWDGDGGIPADTLAQGDPRFPYVGTTYRVTEHWQTGVMTRNTPWLLELQPRQFCELGVELAAEKGIRSGDTVMVSSSRGSLEAVAVVTPRVKPFRLGGRVAHLVGLPWCFGWQTPGTGDSANLLTATVGDPNAMIPETKAFLVGLERKG